MVVLLNLILKNLATKLLILLQWLITTSKEAQTPQRTNLWLPKGEKGKDKLGVWLTYIH